VREAAVDFSVLDELMEVVYAVDVEQPLRQRQSVGSSYRSVRMRPSVAWPCGFGSIASMSFAGPAFLVGDGDSHWYL
jgi:hypothetical protein